MHRIEVMDDKGKASIAVLEIKYPIRGFAAKPRSPEWVLSGRTSF